MVEYYGWLNLQQSLDGENESDILSISGAIKNRLKEISMSERISEFQAINGYFVLNISGITNHMSQDVLEVFDLYKFIASVAIGSYGLLYVKNEQETEDSAEFRVWRLAKGKFEELDQTLLSF